MSPSPLQSTTSLWSALLGGFLLSLAVQGTDREAVQHMLNTRSERSAGRTVLTSGDATNVTTLRIEWPSGIVQELDDVLANQLLTVVESQSYTNTNAIPQFIGAAKVAGGMELSFSEPTSNAVYVLEASTDLATWTKLVVRTSSGVTTNYTDTRAANYARRFYRVLVP